MAKRVLENHTGNVKPLSDRVLVKVIKVEEYSAGGLFVGKSNEDRVTAKATVVAVGPGKLRDNGERIPVGCNPGDTILIGKYAGTDIKIEDEEHKIINEADVLAIL